VLRNGRSIAAIGLAAFAAGGQTAEAVAAAPSNQTPIVYKAEDHNLSRLKTIEQMPGYELKVTPEQRREQRAAVVQIVTQSEAGGVGTTQGPVSWNQWCTGYRVRIPGTPSPYIMSSAHCFESATGSSDGVLSDPTAPQNKAENFISVGNMQYAITVPNTFTDSPYTKSIFPIDGISVDTDNKDVALMRMIPPSPPLGDPGNTQEDNFGYLPAIPMSKFKGNPIPGEEASLLGISQADGAVLESGTGRYFGRVTLDSTDLEGNLVTRKLDIVGIKANLPAADVCNFGDSGSEAQFATGSYTGPLSVRFNFGYGSGRNKIWQQEDYNARMGNRIDVRSIEEQTGVSAKGFTTLCAYTVMGSNTIPNLQVGFNVTASADFVK
jgi:hypothetical protein